MSADATLDSPTLALVRIAAAVAGGDEPNIRHAMSAAIEAGVSPEWVEELLLQSVLMAGYPRALVAFGLWRKVSGRPAPAEDNDSEYAMLEQWASRGESTCTTVYGGNYAGLRRNVRALHPALDRWMLVEGYGRTLSRPGLDLLRRELCTVAQTAVLQTPRQLHSHLRGALNAGASFGQVEAVLGIVNLLLGHEEWKEVKELWGVVRAGRTQED